MEEPHGVEEAPLQLQKFATEKTRRVASIPCWIDRDYPPAYAAYFDLDWPASDCRIDTDAPKATWHDAVTIGLSAF